VGAIDSTLLPAGTVWGSKSRSTHKQLRREQASLGHGSTGAFFGYTFTLLINDRGGVCGQHLAGASTHDLDPVKQGFLDRCIGLVLGDSGYRSKKETQRLKGLSVGLLAKPTVKEERVFTPIEAVLYRSREVIEGVFSLLKRRFLSVPTYPHASEPPSKRTCSVR
jgi:hypothetical protein